MDLCFLAFGVALMQHFSFPSDSLDPVFVSLLVLDVDLNGRSRDFVDPRLLNFHLRSSKMNVEVFSHDLDLSSLLGRPLCSADRRGPTDGDEGFISERSSSDTSSASGVTMG